MPKSVSLLTLFCSIQVLTHAFGTGISGRVFNKLTKQPVASVLVTLNGSEYHTTTNNKGYFNFEDLQEGKYILETQILGFNTFIDTINIKAQESLYREYFITEDILELPIAVIRAYSMTGGMTQDMHIPGSAYYLPLRTLERFEYTDPNRVLAAIPGIQIQEEDGFGLRPNIGFRGSGVERSSKITVMEDGVLAAPAPYTAPAAYYFPSIARMHGLEVLKGSSQIEYGPFTTGGALNLLSMPIPSRLSGRFSTSAGTFNSRKTMVELGGRKGNFGIAVQYYDQGSDGFKQLPDLEDTGFRKQDYMFKLQYQTPDRNLFKHLFSLKWGHTRERSNETYLGLTLDDFAEMPYARYAGSQKDEMNTRHYQHVVRHAMIAPGGWSITTTAYLNTFERNWYKLDKVRDAEENQISISNILRSPRNYPEAFDLLRGDRNGSGLYLKANNRSYVSRGVQTVFAKTFSTQSVSHDFRVGLRMHYDEVDRFQWVDTYAMQNGGMSIIERGIPGTESNRLAFSNAFSGFMKYQLSVGKFVVVPGLRLEEIKRNRMDYGKQDPERTGSDVAERENKTTGWIPGIGIEYQWTSSTSMYAGVHRGFAPPGSQPEARPESSATFEAGLQINKQNLNFQTVFFYSAYQNLLGTDLAAAGGMGTEALFNGGQATTYGLEMQLAGNLSNKRSGGEINFPYQLNYTFTDAYFNNSFESEFDGWGEVENGDALPYMARHRLSAQFAAEHARWTLSLQTNYTGQMRASAGQGAIPESEQIPGYFCIDISAGFQVMSKVQIRAQVYNVLDQTYMVALRPAGARPGLPRMFQMGIQAGF